MNAVTTETPTTSTTDPQQQATAPAVNNTPANNTRWALGLATAAIIGWLAINFFPVRYSLPEELTAGTVANSPDLQAEASRLETENDFKNGLIGLTLVGIAFGLFPAVFAGGGSSKMITGSITGAIVGGLCGAAAMLAAQGLRQVFAAPEADELEQPSMWGDIFVYVGTSILVAIPAGLIFLFRPSPTAIQKFTAVPLAGLVAGLLLPILASLALPSVKLEAVPNPDLALSGLWLGLIAALLFAFTTMTGDKKQATATTTN
ncbi:hypothetical protein SH139x_000169 [Planctomycetaceae bacterium SH139]